MSKSHLPYPGKYESFASWDYRCKQWESNRRRSNSCGLSGRPDYSGLANQGRGVELARVKIAGKPCTVEVPHFAEHDGKRVRVLRYGYGSKAADRVSSWAAKNGAQFARLVNANGRHGMCSRDDGIAYKALAFA